jgi:hypothetical protein
MSLSFTGNASESATATLTGTIPTIQTHNRLMTCWAKFNTVADFQTVLELDGGSGARIQAITMGDGDDGTLRSFFTPNSFGTVWSDPLADTAAGVWLLLAGYMPRNVNGSSLTTFVYRDDDVGAGTSATGTSNTGTMPAFAISNAAVAPLNAKVADAAIWHATDKTQADNIIAALYNSGSGKFANAIAGVASPVKYWPLLNNGTAALGGNNLSVSVASFDAGDHPALTGAGLNSLAIGGGRLLRGPINGRLVA